MLSLRSAQTIISTPGHNDGASAVASDADECGALIPLSHLPSSPDMKLGRVTGTLFGSGLSRNNVVGLVVFVAGPFTLPGSTVTVA